MTGVAVLRSTEMAGLFVIGMATGAATGHILVIESCGQPGCCCMTIITLRLRNNVLRGLVANVTTIARARHDICVIKTSR